MRDQKMMPMPEYGCLEYQVRTNSLMRGPTVRSEAVRPVQLGYQIGRGLAVRLDLAAVIDQYGEPVIAYRVWDSSSSRALARLNELEHAEMERDRLARRAAPTDQHDRWVAAVGDWYA